MHTSRTLIAILATLFAVGATACSDEPKTASTRGVALAATDSLVMGPGGESVRFRSGSVASDTTVTVSALPGRRPPSGTASVATPVRLAPSGQMFAHAVEIEFPIDVASLPPGKTLDDIVVYRASNGSSVLVPVPTRRKSPASVAVITEHFSDFIPVVADADGGAVTACGDDVCATDESCTSCPFDCGLCLPAGECGNGPCDIDCGYQCRTATTVLDSVHGLEWDRTPPATAMSNATAASYCAALTLGGYPAGSWHLPTYYEIATLVEPPRNRPAIDDTIFVFTTATAIVGWTSTPVAGSASSFWASQLGGIGSLQSWLGSGQAICVHTNQPLVGGLVDNLDGTVTDQRTGLLWQQVASTTARNSIDQSNFCATIVLGGLPAGSWRAPSFLEQASLVDTTRQNPALDPVAFPGAPATGNFCTRDLATGGTYFAVNSATGMLTSGFGFTSQTLVRCVH